MIVNQNGNMKQNLYDNEPNLKRANYRLRMRTEPKYEKLAKLWMNKNISEPNK